MQINSIKNSSKQKDQFSMIKNSNKKLIMEKVNISDEIDNLFQQNQINQKKKKGLGQKHTRKNTPDFV